MSRKEKRERQKKKYLGILEAQSMKMEWLAYSKNLDVNKLSRLLFAQTDEFLLSDEWRELRIRAFEMYGRNCVKCGRTEKPGFPTHIDHIKPRRYYPQLALDITNLQPLCGICNKEKGNRHKTDYRNQ